METIYIMKYPTAAALSEICSRNSKLAFCQPSAQQTVQQSDNLPPPASNYPLPPALPILSSTSSCDQFAKMGQAQCQNGSADSVFCNTYRQLCTNSTSSTTDNPNQGVLDCQKENLHYFFECTRQSLKLMKDLIFCRNYQVKCINQQRFQDTPMAEQQQSSNDVQKMMLEQQMRMVAAEPRNEQENSETTLDDLCQRHKNLGDKFCTGFEKDIQFGDWGAKVDTKTGVSDFYKQNEHSEADWMDGSFDDRSVDWSVPVVGIHGYDHGLVKLNGIVNPSDLPSVLAGGVPALGPPSVINMVNIICTFPNRCDFRLKKLYLVMTTVLKAIRWAQGHGLPTRVMQDKQRQKDKDKNKDEPF
uniref:Uncharacterized protein n=1 Tax=Romanomermis culicivorax TaxID=13658 RepID=A0A915JK88_ROMCU